MKYPIFKNYIYVLFLMHRSRLFILCRYRLLKTELALGMVGKSMYWRLYRGIKWHIGLAVCLSVISIYRHFRYIRTFNIPRSQAELWQTIYFSVSLSLYYLYINILLRSLQHKGACPIGKFGICFFHGSVDSMKV